MEMIPQLPVDPPDWYWGQDEEEDYALDLSKIEAEDKLQPCGGQAPHSTIPTPILVKEKGDNMASKKQRKPLEDAWDTVWFNPMAEIEAEKREIERQEKTSTEEAQHGKAGRSRHQFY